MPDSDTKWKSLRYLDVAVVCGRVLAAWLLKGPDDDASDELCWSCIRNIQSRVNFRVAITKLYDGRIRRNGCFCHAPVTSYALSHRILHDHIRCWPPTPTICQHAPAHHPTDEDKLRWPQLLCPWTNCVEQSAVRFAVYRHLTEHFQEQTENISVWRWRALAHLLHLRIWAI